MNQAERRRYLIDRLLEEEPQYKKIQIPDNTTGQKQLLRSLMNIRAPKEIDDAFAQIQDAYLKQENIEKGEVTLSDMREFQPDLYLWKGDITRLKVGAIVNAANSGMMGCYQPCHNCIDNCIHTYAGIQLRKYCGDLMEKQGHEEPTGQAKITPAFNLPCDYVIHTVGPILRTSIIFRICIPAAFIPMKHWKNIGHTGAVIFTSTAIWMHPNRSTTDCLIW